MREVDAHGTIGSHDATIAQRLYLLVLEREIGTEVFFPFVDMT
jgi:hypothetical protein